MYLDYFNTNTPIIKAKRGELLTIDPNNIDSIKAFQDEAVRLGLMKQEDLVGRGYGSYGPKTKAAYAHYQNGITPSAPAETVKPGAYYLSYPGHKINLNGQVTNKDVYAPVGHGGVVIVGDDGSVTQYDYGRYKYEESFGNRNENKYQGNWKRTDRSPVDIGSATYAQLLENVMDSGTAASENVRLTYAHDADPAKVQEWIENDANNLDRLTYGIPFSKEKRQNLIHGEAPLGQRVRDLCTSKGCAQSAYDAVQAGVPTSRKVANVLNKVSKATNPIGNLVTFGKELISKQRDGVGAEISFSPRNRERNLQNQGYKTYDSNNYIDYD